MTLSASTNRNNYTGNGAVNQYSYTFKIFQDSDLEVTVQDTSTPGVETVLSLTTDYTVAGTGDTAGGSITLVNSGQAWLTGGNLTTGYRLTVRRKVSLVQNTDIRNQGDFYPDVIEDELDKQVMQTQQQQDEVDRAVKLPTTQTTADLDPTLPTDLAGNPNRCIVTDNLGTSFETGPTTDEISNAQGYAQAAIAAQTAAEAAQAAAETSETNAATSETNAATSASNAATSETNAAASASAASTSASNAATSESNAATSASNASTSETNAAASAAAASTSETNAATSASNAATSETNAATSASNAATSETNAATSASNAATSETNAATSETNAAASAAAAATSASSSLWNDVAFKVFGDSPISVVDGDTGTMFAVDCSGGDVVINLPAISTLTLTSAWSIGVKKTDVSSNKITINANGSEVIDGGSSIEITSAEEGVTLIPDTDPAPDAWTSIRYGAVVASEGQISDWQTYTPTGSYTAATYTGRYRRVGSVMELFIKIAFSGADATGSAVVNLPSGFTIDTTAIVDGFPDSGQLGRGVFRDASSGTHNLIASRNTDTSLALRYGKDFSPQIYFVNVTQANTGTTFASGDAIIITAKVPVNEWNATAITTPTINDYGFKATRLTDQTITISSLQEVLWNGEQYDRGNSFNTSTGRFQPPVAGLYKLNTNMMLDNITAGGGDIRVSIYLNNLTEIARGYLTQLPGTTTTFYGNLDVEVELNGTTDFVHVFVASGSDTNYDVNANPAFSFFTGHLVTAKTATPVSDSTAARGYNDSTQTIASNTITVMEFPTITEDTQSYWDGVNHRFQPTVAGRYHFGAYVRPNNPVFTSGTRAVLEAYKSGSLYSELGRFEADSSDNAGGTFVGFGSSDYVYLNGTGDYIDFRFTHTVAPNMDIGTSSSSTRFFINKIGD